MNLSNKKVFEGSKYRSLIRQLNLHQRKYNNIDFNKIILSDLIPDFEPDSRKNIFLHIQNIFYSIRYLLYICIWLFLYKKVIYFKKNNNCNIWFILPPSNRDVYLNEIKKFNFYNIKPTIISWRKEFNGINIFKNIRRVFSFFVLIKKTKLKFLNLEKLIYTNFVIFKSMDLLDSFKMIDQLPKAIYSQKDYQRYENALIQICNLYSVETFTSQHTVPHVFSDKNERVGNIMVTNNVSKNFLIWGHFAKNIYRKYNPSSSFFYYKSSF